MLLFGPPFLKSIVINCKLPVPPGEDFHQHYSALGNMTINSIFGPVHMSPLSGPSHFAGQISYSVHMSTPARIEAVT